MASKMQPHYDLKSSGSEEIFVNSRGELLDKWRPHLAAWTLLKRGAEYLFIISVFVYFIKGDMQNVAPDRFIMYFLLLFLIVCVGSQSRRS